MSTARRLGGIALGAGIAVAVAAAVVGLTALLAHPDQPAVPAVPGHAPSINRRGQVANEVVMNGTGTNFRRLASYPVGSAATFTLRPDGIDCAVTRAGGAATAVVTGTLPPRYVAEWVLRAPSFMGTIGLFTRLGEGGLQMTIVAADERLRVTRAPVTQPVAPPSDPLPTDLIAGPVATPNLQVGRNLTVDLVADPPAYAVYVDRRRRLDFQAFSALPPPAQPLGPGLTCGGAPGSIRIVRMLVYALN